MIQESKCSECSQLFQVLWDDNIDAIVDEYERDDLYSDMLGHMEETVDSDDEILFCPFCGAEAKVL